MNVRTLLLNASYQPLRVISYRRAVCLVYEDKATVLLNHPEFVLHSPSTEMPCPWVIVLREYVDVPYTTTRLPLGKRAVLARDKYECAYCGFRATEVDHIQPRSKGGQNIWMNVIASCRECNAYKGNKILGDGPGELNWQLRFQPTVPPSSTYILARPHEMEAWKDYLGSHYQPSAHNQAGYEILYT